MITLKRKNFHLRRFRPERDTVKVSTKWGGSIKYKDDSEIVKRKMQLGIIESKEDPFYQKMNELRPNA